MMSRRDMIVLTVSPALVLAVFLAFVIYLIEGGRIGGSESSTGEDTYREVMAVIESEYVAEIPREQLIYGAMKGMLSSLDEFSRGYDPDEWSEFQQSSDGKSAGIGVRIGRLLGAYTLIHVVDGGPAARAGLEVGDRIRAVDRKAAVAGEGDVLRERISGAPGTALEITVERGDPPTEVTVEVVRGEYKAESVHAKRFGDHAVVRVSAFNAQTADDVRRALDRMAEQGAKGVVLDLRDNGGGSLQAAIGVVGCFMSTERVLTSVYRRREEVYETKGLPVCRDLPLAVLVNAESASASEVVAAALQDYQRGFVLGEHTYGKGVVQNVFGIESRAGGVKLTTAHYVTPAGRSLQRGPEGDDKAPRGGIVPDFPVRVSAERMEAIREEWERQMFRDDIAAALRRELKRPAAIRDDGSVDDPQMDAAFAFLERRPLRAAVERP